ncbi:MAG: hypothetical protein GVY24_08250, partial [Planctomycetes bacterium]|nr:hypothetical protein [Planctomycetota bacterium]
MNRSRTLSVALLGLLFVLLVSDASAMLNARMGRFMQRDPAGYIDGQSFYQYQLSAPSGNLDWTGMAVYVDVWRTVGWAGTHAAIVTTHIDPGGIEYGYLLEDGGAAYLEEQGIDPYNTTLHDWRKKITGPSGQLAQAPFNGWTRFPVQCSDEPSDECDRQEGESPEDCIERAFEEARL